MNGICLVPKTRFDGPLPGWRWRDISSEGETWDISAGDGTFYVFMDWEGEYPDGAVFLRDGVWVAKAFDPNSDNGHESATRWDEMTGWVVVYQGDNPLEAIQSVERELNRRAEQVFGRGSHA